MGNLWELRVGNSAPGGSGSATYCIEARKHNYPRTCPLTGSRHYINNIIISRPEKSLLLTNNVTIPYSHAQKLLFANSSTLRCSQDSARVG